MMIKKLVFLIALLVVVSSCKPKQSVAYKKTQTQNTSLSSKNLGNKIVDYAMRFKGVKYKYGGSTRKGMDCSGLVVTTFNHFDIALPRTSKAQSLTGKWIDLKTVKPGDLMFFATKKNSRKITHVGIVTNTKSEHVEFIHASTSEGVTISNLGQRYWYFAFVQARRII
jgi:probable lipoprotein NlpC